jgi:hypothetical protein
LENHDSTEPALPVEAPPVEGLSESAQRWNSLVFILNTSIGYLVAPVFYVGVLHAAILSSRNYSDTVANLPESVFMWMTPAPLLVAWLWPSVKLLKPLLIVTYLVRGAAGVAAAALFVLAPDWLAIGVTVHAGIVGITNGVTAMCLWELIGRCMTPERRGWTLGVTYGVGPACAVIGSCASQLILAGDFLGVIRMTPVPEPWSYVILFGVTCPAMILSACCALLAKTPRVEAVAATANTHVLQGLRDYLGHPLIVIALVGFLLTGAGGNMIMNNVALFVRDVLGEPPQAYTGTQLALRFGCKSLSGFLLGWMMVRFSTKTPALMTTLFCIAGIVWALVVPGHWYLFSIGLLGAGELYYVYYLNYIVGCSAPERIRENTAYTNCILVTVSLLPLLYGWLSENYGLRSSFYVALGLLLATVFLIGRYLPPEPRRASVVTTST